MANARIVKVFQIGHFVVARFLLTSASRGPSATAELRVLLEERRNTQIHIYTQSY